jgi:hypothetical protein
VYEDLKPLYDVIDGKEDFPALPKVLWSVFGHSSLMRLELNQKQWTPEYTARVRSHIDAYAWKQLAVLCDSRPPAATLTGSAEEIIQTQAKHKAPLQTDAKEAHRFNLLEID